MKITIDTDSFKFDIGEVIESSINKLSNKHLVAFLAIFGISMIAYALYAVGPVFGRNDFFYISQRAQSITPSYSLEARPLFWFISHKIMPGSFVPVLSTTIATLFLAVSGMLLSRIFQLSKTIDFILVSLLFCVCPVFTQQQGYNMWDVALAAAVLFPILSFYILQNYNGTPYFIAASAMLSCTIPIYQPMINIFLITTVLSAIQKTLTDFENENPYKKILSEIKKPFFAFLIAVGTYIPIYIYMTKSISSGYAAFQNQKIDTIATLLSNTRNIAETFLSLVFGQNSYIYREHFYYIPIIMVIAILAGYILSIKKYKAPIKITIALLLLIPSMALCLRIESIPLANFVNMPRLWGAIPVFIAFIGAACISNTIKPIRNIGYICATLLIISFTMFHSVQSFFIWNENFYDLSVANRVAARIESHPQYNRTAEYYIHIVGEKRPSTTARGLFKTPLQFNAITTNGDYFPYMMRLLGLENIYYDWPNLNNAALQGKMKQEAGSMPKWPAKGSIKFTDQNRIILNF